MKTITKILTFIVYQFFLGNLTIAQVYVQNDYSTNSEKFFNQISYGTESILLNVPHLRQCDLAWSNIQLGTCSGLTICSDGCTVTCMAMLLNAHQLNVTPSQLNIYLNTHSGYSQGCLLVWNVATSYPGSSVSFTGSPGFSLSTVKSEIDNQDPVIVYTRINGIDHFIVVKGYMNNGTNLSDFIVLDPLRSTESNLSNYSPLLSLRTFDNVITTSGYASILSGVTIEPNPVIRTQQATISVVLKEVNGAPIIFDTLTCAILFNGQFKFDFPRRTNVTVPANGTYTYQVTSSQFGPGTSLASHQAWFRGYKIGFGWFNFSVLPSGINPLTFNVVAPTSITPTSNILPSEYKLYQCFPNPFNAETIIYFDLPVSNFVNLIVFDIQGKEIQTLLNEHLDEGSYRLRFNASDYPSGAYFYKLVTADFSDIKKMILVR
ncbi:MAG TPA: hypothetical protein DCY06_09640 [Bacteroidetes bacterium]|nr:hypothetical protein [Bacteroidota bacterium]HRK00675.1 C39 family peptidase [Ignavibacteria bacterium]